MFSSLLTRRFFVTKVKVPNSTDETKRLQDSVRASVNSMMHTSTEETFNLSLQLFYLQFQEQEVFIAYFNRLWVSKKELWSKAWRQVSYTFALVQWLWY